MSVSANRPITTLSMREYLHHRDKARFIQEFGESLEHTGFAIIVDHPVEPKIIHQAYGATRRVFSFSDEELAKYVDTTTKGQRGLTKFGVEGAKNQQKGDLKRFWMVGHEFETKAEQRRSGLLPNIWPTAEAPEFKIALTHLHHELGLLSDLLLGALEHYLGLEDQELSEMTVHGDTVLRAIHYPMLDTPPEPGQVRSAEHEDICLITLLVEATSAGLEVKGNNGEWWAVNAPKNAIIVNAGDMLQLYCAKRDKIKHKIRSTTHRVTNTGIANVPRYSLPYFVHPAKNTILDPSEGAEYPTAWDYLMKRLREIGLDVEGPKKL